ncbi:alpha/beta-hydrolase [Glonium stellatum]|uniref:Carboxylic ester hydrolase n=1 Tax=Glonium stellatum TaxID=574774 RepID=A0A8E2FAA9_9PEZI|nr:alpha/beta-hydrolase [Glonium stellatum]
MLLLNWKAAALSWACGALAVPTAEWGSKAPIATVKNGTYAGIHSTEYNQDFFLGIPFAQPPVGNLRFRAPQSLTSSWKGIKPATSYSAACVGYGSDDWPYPKLSEDCLYLNVIRPSGYEKQKLPIAFWIHGGGLTEGSGIDQRYNLSFIVERSVKIGKPIIGVSTNYRLDMWGFITGEEVIQTGNANIGFRDQRLALYWVQENIEAFGGDPRKVTIWGESAGALSVGMHLTAFGGRDDRIFRGGIMESGNPVYYGSLGHWDKMAFTNATNALGCGFASDKLQCLREIPFATLNAWINGTGSSISWQPIIDGDFIQGYTSLQLAKGKFVHVPIISGANSDEGSAFGPIGINSTQDFVDSLENNPSPATLPAASVTSVLSAYPATITYGAVPTTLPPSFVPPAPYGASWRRSAAYYGDVVMIAHRRLTCETWAANCVPAFCYRFNTVPHNISAIVGATHFQEVAFVFNNKNGVGYPPVAVDPFEGEPQAYFDLSDMMSAAWVSFVHDGVPATWWPEYEAGGKGQNYVFDANVTGLGYSEADKWRAAGIALINSWNADVYLR